MKQSEPTCITTRKDQGHGNIKETKVSVLTE